MSSDLLLAESWCYRKMGQERLVRSHVSDESLECTGKWGSWLCPAKNSRASHCKVKADFFKGGIHTPRASPVASCKEFICNAGDTGDSSSVPGLGRSPGGGHGNPLQYSCQNSRQPPGWATVHGVTKSRTQLSDPHFHVQCITKSVLWTSMSTEIESYTIFDLVGSNHFLLSLQGFCHSFQGCALPSSLLFHRQPSCTSL